MRVVCILLLSALLASPAHAESPAEAEARAHYTAGQKLFDNSRYAEAMVELEQSYALSKYPAILHKIALCQDQLGRLADALATYQRYLEADPQSTRRQGVEQRMAAIREQLKPPAPKSPADQPPTVATVVHPPAQLDAAPRAVPVYKRWWLWTIVGVAAVGLGVGLGVGLTVGGSAFHPNLPAIEALRF